MYLFRETVNAEGCVCEGLLIEVKRAKSQNSKVLSFRFKVLGFRVWGFGCGIW